MNNATNPSQDSVLSAEEEKIASWADRHSLTLGRAVRHALAASRRETVEWHKNWEESHLAYATSQGRIFDLEQERQAALDDLKRTAKELWEALDRAQQAEATHRTLHRALADLELQLRKREDTVAVLIDVELA